MSEPGNTSQGANSPGRVSRRIWLVQLGEPLPTDGGFRLFRCGSLARALADAGHDVTWWTSSFSHLLKRHRADGASIIDIQPNYRIALLPARGYARNVSVDRLLFHYEVTAAFRRTARTAATPSLIFAGFPLPSLAAAAVEFGRARGVPTLVDIRDIWPEALTSLLPRRLESLTKFLFWPMNRRNGRTFRHATGIIGTSRSYLNWALRLAARDESPSDQVILMGYPAIERAAPAVAAASAMWTARGVPGSAFTCCFFGSINRHFDFETVIRAAERLEQEHTGRFRFVLCGAGDQLAHWRARAARLPGVMFPGLVGAADITALMGLCHAGLAPYSERATMSLPNKPFEYLAGGLPVVSSLGGELVTMLQESGAGLSYKPGDANSLCDHLIQLASSEAERRAMAARATALFREHLTVEHSNRALVQHIERLASQRLAS